MNSPRWRWALFCAALEAHRITQWTWANQLWAWCILPEWLASEEDLERMQNSPTGNEPF